MLFLVYIFLIIFFSIQSRLYDSIDVIKDELNKRIHNLNIKFDIQGTNDYLYKFESRSLIFNFNNGSYSDIDKNIKLSNKKIEILFNLSIYESNDRIFNHFNKKIIYTELIKIGILFDLLRFYQCKPDFTFDVFYKIDDFNEDVIIYFDRINELEIFNYLIYEETDDYYANKTLYNLMKTNIVNNFIMEIKKILVTYPECDLLYNIKSYFDYIIGNLFKFDKCVSDLTYYKGTILNIYNQTTIKKDDCIILQNVNIQLELKYYNTYAEEDDMDDKKDKQLISLEYLSFDSNKTISFGRLTKGEYFVFDIFKIILKDSKDQF
jgi:hypothetical protein